MAFKGRFHSIEHIAQRAKATLFRFPFPLASAALGTLTGVYMIEHEGILPTESALKLLMTCGLGLPLFIALTTWAERRPWSDIVKRLFPALGVVLLVAYYFSLPERISSPVFHTIRFLLLALGAHFLVAFLAFLGRDDRVGYWQYNKTLFLRALLANLYFQVLFGGLALALAAAQHLFGLDIHGKMYGQLGVILLGVFQTWVFLAGVPDRLGDLNRPSEFPPGLKVFTQFILLPLVVLYFAILITYEAKILITWNWPEGWVAYLVLSYSVVSILSLLLLHPLQTQVGNRWIATFGSWFFRGLVPLLVMLYFAIFQRISEYGVTVNRFLVVNMAVGLTLVVLYFVLGRSRDIRIIPIVLCGLCLVSAYGPFSAFSVSERSQRSRLESYLTESGLMSNGVIQPGTGPVADSVRREMSSIVDYLIEWHGQGTLAAWVDTAAVDTTVEESERYGREREVLCQRLGFEYDRGWRSPEGQSHFVYSVDAAERTALALAGWSHLLEYSYGGDQDSVVTFALSGDSCHVHFDSTAQLLTVWRGADRSHGTPASRLDLGARVRELKNASMKETIEPSRLVFAPDSGSLPCEWHFENIGGLVKDGEVRINWLRAQLLIDLK